MEHDDEKYADGDRPDARRHKGVLERNWCAFLRFCIGSTLDVQNAISDPFMSIRSASIRASRAVSQ